jgi:hypothetical protein
MTNALTSRKNDKMFLFISMLFLMLGFPGYGSDYVKAFAAGPSDWPDY